MASIVNRSLKPIKEIRHGKQVLQKERRAGYQGWRRVSPVSLRATTASCGSGCAPITPTARFEQFAGIAPADRRGGAGKSVRDESARRSQAAEARMAKARHHKPRQLIPPPNSHPVARTPSPTS